MAYHLYNTEGFILASQVLGETGRLYSIFTPRFGLVKAIATGVREEKSKLRYSLSVYSHVEVSLIRGKEFWRIVGVEKSGLLDYLSLSPEKKKTVARIFSLLLRLIHGEEESGAIFQDLRRALTALSNYSEDRENLTNWESLCVLMVLKHLGYLKVTPELSLFLDSSNWAEERISAFTAQRPQAIKTINYLLRRSHL